MNPSSSSSFPSSHSLPSSLVQSVRNNHVPPDTAPENIASLAPLPTRQSLLDALSETDNAIRQVDEKLSQIYFRNATFSREVDGLNNLNGAIDWFTSAHNQATQNARTAVNEKREYVAGDEEMDTLMSTKNITTTTLVLLNSMHTAFVLSSETEKNLVLGEMDVAFQNLGMLERTITDLRGKNASLSILNTLDERVSVLRDVLCVEAERTWGKLVMFSEEGDIQLTIKKHCEPSSENSTELSIAAVAELLKSLNLLEGTMKSLASLLSRAFLDHLLENPVGWQFIYRKHDPITPSITMTPTNLVIADLTPYAHRIFAYFSCIVDFLASNLPSIALHVLIPLIVPPMTTELCKSWLGKYIPHSMDTLTDYEQLILAAENFEKTLHSLSWSVESPLHEWCAKAGEHWAHQHKLDILDHVRTILQGGVHPNTCITASSGAVEYEDIGFGRTSSSDWTWNEDRGSPPSTRSSIGRKTRITRATSRTYECTAISGALKTVVGVLLQEYTNLFNLEIIQDAQGVYPEMIRQVFVIFRACGVLYTSVEAETPLRLVNDCFYLSGEIGLMALGIGHIGFQELTMALDDVSKTMDLCGISWRQRYLVHALLENVDDKDNIRVTLSQRVRAAEGFVFPSNPERKERYQVVISGLIQQIQSFSNMWSRVMTLDERCTALGTNILSILEQVMEDILLLPTLVQPDSSALSAIYSPLLSLDGLFSRNRIYEFMPSWGRYKVFPQLLELDPNGILVLWRTGRLSAAGWDAADTIEIIDKRFERNADSVIREIRRTN